MSMQTIVAKGIGSKEEPDVLFEVPVELITEKFTDVLQKKLKTLLETFETEEEKATFLKRAESQLTEGKMPSRAKPPRVKNPFKEVRNVIKGMLGAKNMSVRFVEIVSASGGQTNNPTLLKGLEQNVIENGTSFSKTYQTGIPEGDTLNADGSINYASVLAQAWTIVPESLRGTIAVELPSV